MSLITLSSSGKPQIRTREALIEIRDEHLPSKTELYTDILGSLDARIKADFPTVSNEALSNSHSDWYEWLLAINAWNQTRSILAAIF